MRIAGIDIGSRTVKLAVLDSGALVHSRIEPNTHDPLAVCRQMLDGVDYDAIAATGYGRRLFASYRDCKTVTEISAAAHGARYFFPACRAVLDIGGQDTKVISLDEEGRVRKFEMNDKCSAGTGRFLEVMASALSWSMGDFIHHARVARQAQKVSAMCTVFAESEVVSLVARGIPRDELALGIHQAIVQRALSLLKKIDHDGEIVFCGGGALNGSLVELLSREIGVRLAVPEEPQILAAVGAAMSI